jgi:polysaccharide export outer membrane protein
MIRFASMVVLMLLAGSVHSSAAGQASPASAAASCANEPADAASYRLQVGDVLDINFRFTPEFNASPSIRPDGRIAMSGVGEVAAQGLTTSQLTCALAHAYTFLHDPIISVSVRNFETPSFIVGGEVERPGKYDLRTETTITEAIAIAGGFKRSAKQSQVYLFRRGRDSGQIEPQLLDVQAILEKGRVAQDVVLQRDVMLFVPESGFSKIERFIPVPGIGLFLPVR